METEMGTGKRKRGQKVLIVGNLAGSGKVSQVTELCLKCQELLQAAPESDNGARSGLMTKGSVKQRACFLLREPPSWRTL